MKLLPTLVLGVVLLPALLTPAVSALDIPPAPIASPVVDQADILTPEQEVSLSTKIVDAEKTTGNQVAVLTVPSLEGEVIEEYALDVARGWGIGSDQRDSGVLLLIAVQDRTMRIEVGYGLEGALPDIRAGQIIRDRIRPSFVKNEYYAGINSGVDGILLAIQGEKDPNLQSSTVGQAPKSQIRLPWEFLIFALFIIPSWMGAILGRSKRWWPGGVLGFIVAAGAVAFIGLTAIGIGLLILLPLIGLLFDRSVSRNFQRRLENGMAPSWWAGGGFFGGGGGNGGGWGGFGGGGDFGGGGASGDW